RESIMTLHLPTYQPGDLTLPKPLDKVYIVRSIKTWFSMNTDILGKSLSTLWRYIFKNKVYRNGYMLERDSGSKVIVTVSKPTMIYIAGSGAQSYSLVYDVVQVLLDVIRRNTLGKGDITRLSYCGNCYRKKRPNAKTWTKQIIKKEIKSGRDDPSFIICDQC